MDQETRERVDHVFASLCYLVEENKLTDNEESVIISVEEQYKKYKTISQKQIDMIENIYRRACSR